MEFGSTSMEALGPIQTFVGRKTGASIYIATDSERRFKQIKYKGKSFNAKTKNQNR